MRVDSDVKSRTFSRPTQLTELRSGVVAYSDVSQGVESEHSLHVVFGQKCV